MNIQHIDLTDLTPAKINVRKTGAKDTADLVASIRAIGLLQPLLVRASGEGFEVVAGQRRYHALVTLAEEQAVGPVPCMVMERDDDAAAVEASLAENVARLPMDEVDQFRAFAKLVTEDRTVTEIAMTFGITERMVQQRLALSNLQGPILTAYRKGDIDAGTLRTLTLASIAKQKEWWALVKDEDARAPMGRHLKDWLFGGAHIPTAHALFDLEAAGLTVVSDLFGEAAYFSDAGAFWPVQNIAIADLSERYKADGWDAVVVMEVGDHWYGWEHVRTAKEDGGKVYLTCTRQGEVEAHEGHLTQAEADRLRKQAQGIDTTPARPEITKAMVNYLDLHRHAAVRADLLTRPDIALRLIVAHMIAGSSLWSVQADPQRAAKPEIADSLANNRGHQTFQTARQEIVDLLDLLEVSTPISDGTGYAPRPAMSGILTKLMDLTDAKITRILTVLMAATLETGEIVETLAQTLHTDMPASWTLDDTFFDLMRDKEALNGMVAEIAGETAAKESVTATAKTQKAVIKACLDGSRPAQVENWNPRYMAVPMQGYTARNDFAGWGAEAAPEITIAAE